MAHQWYLQHGGKQYGPLTSAQLKKLAGEGKIGPASQVRLGTEGHWTTAGRVQGLFPGQPSGDTLPKVVPVAAPPLPPPVATPLARVPVGSISQVAKISPDTPSLAGKLVGAVGLIFGILALASCWLPLLDSLLGWMGIVVGGIGLLLGIVGLVLAAMHGGAGLYLNVAAASSSLVGLALTVVLGIKFGMFSTPMPVTTPLTPAPTTVLTAPAPAPVPDAREPELEIPPEPVWTDASEAVEQGPLRVKIARVDIQQVRLESLDLTQMRRSKPQPMLHVSVSIENLMKDKVISVPGWNGPVAGLPSGVSDLLKGSELGGQLESATATATLTDQAGNFFPQTPAVRLSAAQADLSASPAVGPGKTVQRELLFDPPLESSEYLRLELPASGFSGTEPIRFQIPRTMFAGD